MAEFYCPVCNNKYGYIPTSGSCSECGVSLDKLGRLKTELAALRRDKEDAQKWRSQQETSVKCLMCGGPILNGYRCVHVDFEEIERLEAKAKQLEEIEARALKKEGQLIRLSKYVNGADHSCAHGQLVMLYEVMGWKISKGASGANTAPIRG